MVPPASALDPVAARSLVGVTGLPTIVATGPFDNQPYAEQLAAAFAMCGCGAGHSSSSSGPVHTAPRSYAEASRKAPEH
jgi:hypothetical protein